MKRRGGSAARLVLLAAGLLGWGLYGARLQRRSLHTLQLENYQTVRFLRWWLGRPARLTPPGRAAGSALGSALLVAAGLGRGPFGWLGLLTWAGLGVAMGAPVREPPPKKPLAMTARARRLAAGQLLVHLVAALGLARLMRRRGGTGAAGAADGLAGGALALTVGTLGPPVAAAAANLLLYPVEAGFRQYYLRDAGRKLRRLSPIVVAVAGSYGKTSTKEFTATILSARFEVLKPPGSYNTPMGLSRVIREQLSPRHEVFVAELGDWVPGDIAQLCRLLRPRVGLLTAIGPEHLERFKTMARVEASKLELLESLPDDGTAVVNQDDEAVRRLADRTPNARVLRYGIGTPGARLVARDVRTTRDGLEFTVAAEGHGEAHFKVGVLGRHNVSNLLAATGAALALGMTLEEIARAAGRIQPVEHRLQPIASPGGVLVIDDAFNSNPRGAAAALEVLADLDGGQRILVTPGMVELAEREFDENRAFARRAAGVCDQVIVVGRDRAAPFIAGLQDAGYPGERLHVVGDLAEATSRLGSLVRAGDVVLFENDLPDHYADVP